jgi:hypothetical protein
MRKEMPVIPVNRVVDPKRIIGKMEGRGGGEALGVSLSQKNNKMGALGRSSPVRRAFRFWCIS